MKKFIPIICIVLVVLLVGAFLLCKNFKVPSNEAELIEKLQAGDIDATRLKELVETGNYDLEILQKELKNIWGVDAINFKGFNEIEILCYGIKEYSVEMLEPNAPVYVGEDKEKLFDELGKYRFKIYIKDSNPTKNFSDKFKSHTVYELPENDDFKFVYTNLPETHATEVYIGSDSPFLVDEENVQVDDEIKIFISTSITHLS